MKSTIEKIKSAIGAALENYQKSNSENSLSDLHIYLDEENDVLSFFDDMENQLYSIDWSDTTHKTTFSSLRQALKELEKEKIFNKDFIFKPFTVNLVDKDFLITEELIFIDDENIQLNNDIWTALDKELDDFFSELMNK